MLAASVWANDANGSESNTLPSPAILTTMIRPSAALLRPIARQVAARRFASTTAGGIEHHSPSDPIPAPPRGVAPDPQRASSVVMATTTTS